MTTSEKILNFVPAGVTVTVQAPPTAIAQVRTAQGDFRFGLQELDYGHELSLRDGDVVVQRTPTPQQISPVPQGAKESFARRLAAACLRRSSVSAAKPTQNGALGRLAT